MKKTLSFVTMIFAMAVVNAQIEYTSFENNPIEITSEYELSFSGSASAEFMIQNYSSYGEAVYFASFENGAAVVSTEASYNANVDILTENTEIGPASVFYGCQGGSPYFNVLYLPDEYQAWASVTAFVGVKFVKSSTNTTHYGWAKIRVEPISSGGMRVFLYGYAYQLSPNTPILAGATNNSGLNNVTENEFRVFPNPAKDVLNIEGENIRNISLYNCLGQQEKEYSFSEGRLDVSNLSKGVYILNINSDKGTTKQKFIKE